MKMLDLLARNGHTAPALRPAPGQPGRHRLPASGWWLDVDPDTGQEWTCQAYRPTVLADRDVTYKRGKHGNAKKADEKAAAATDEGANVRTDELPVVAKPSPRPHPSPRPPTPTASRQPDPLTSPLLDLLPDMPAAASPEPS